MIRLKDTKITKIFVPVILFYGNNNACFGFVRWVLCVLILLKIFASMKLFEWGL